MANPKYNDKKNSKFVNLSRYPARTARENALIRKDPFGDKDRDGVPNIHDCRPMDKKKQGAGLLGGLLALAVTASVAGAILNKSAQNVNRGGVPRKNQNKKSKGMWGY